MPTPTDPHSASALGEASFTVVEFAPTERKSETIPLEPELATAEPAVRFGGSLERAR
jgi:hypothetical protein